MSCTRAFVKDAIWTSATTRDPYLSYPCRNFQLIAKSGVPSYEGGQDEIVYLVTSIEQIHQHDLPFVFTDRNAALGYAR